MYVQQLTEVVSPPFGMLWESTSTLSFSSFIIS